jgi:5'-nucleotidase
MNVLITNDDGLTAEGLQSLCAALRANGKHQITIIAPDSNRSGVSNALSILNNPVKLVKHGEQIYSCSGYPADCVVVALKGALAVKPDLVLSGINHGENLGTDIIYSGTAAAARQAGLAGIPAVALSLVGRGDFHWEMASSWVVNNLEALLTFWKKDCFVNVNIPNSPDGPEGMLEAPPSVRKYKDSMTIMDAPDGSQWCFLQGEGEIPSMYENSDCAVVLRNYVSVSSVYCYPVQNPIDK